MKNTKESMEEHTELPVQTALCVFSCDASVKISVSDDPEFLLL